MKGNEDRILELLPDDIRIAYQEGDTEKVEAKLNELENYGRAESLYAAAAAHAIGFGRRKQNIKKAIELYERSAEKGYAPAMNSLGLAYMEGYGVDVDYEKARNLFEKGVELGNADAACNLGTIYDEGLGVIKNSHFARQNYEKAIEFGDVDAYCNLAIMYEDGIGVKQNSAKAIGLLRQGAERGSVDAMYNLGVIYSQGKLTPRDKDEARLWFGRAAALGDEEADEELRKLY